MKKPGLRQASILNHDEEEFQFGPVVPPIYQNSLFGFKSWDDIDKAFDNKSKDFIYSRLLNPTAVVAENKIARIAGADKAKLCASGIAAISSAIMHFVKAGDHIITCSNIYGPSNRFINNYLSEKLGITSSFIDGTQLEEFENNIKENTSLIFLESPASLKFDLQDLKAVSAIAKRNNLKTIIDNTWATPLFQKPLELGIDVEVHSVSKYLCGHSDVVAGVIISDEKTVDDIIQSEHELLGAKIAPFEAWLILRSLRTLSLRMKAHHESAMKIAEYLEKHPKVNRVYYPGLKSFPQYNLAKEQMSGFSGLLSFELDTHELSAIKNFVNALNMFTLGVSWGGHDSLVYAPAISYSKELSPSQYEAFDIHPGLIRISVGLEDISDLLDDLEQAFVNI